MFKESSALFCLALILGCAQTRTETFDISVRNSGSRPITIGLAKDGPPYEPAWASPEDIAIGSPKNNERWGLQVVPPGRTALTNGLKGKFQKDSSGWLRVYQGDLTISEMLAISRGSANRLDLPLRPGKNEFVIDDRNGRLSADAGDRATGP